MILTTPELEAIYTALPHMALEHRDRLSLQHKVEDELALRERSLTGFDVLVKLLRP